MSYEEVLCQHPVYVLRLRVAFRACVCTSNVRKRVSVVCASVYDPCASVYESQLERVCAHQPCASARGLSLSFTHTHSLTHARQHRNEQKITKSKSRFQNKKNAQTTDSETKQTHTAAVECFHTIDSNVIRKKPSDAAVELLDTIDSNVTEPQHTVVTSPH